ncbi:transposase [Streptomyces pratensis]|uniref:transposase n=1 Tax=Streptomyces pratensis TaxID=1169025 RepID=UPI003AFA97DA
MCDRLGEYGSKMHLITERTGMPISVAVCGANVHDSQALTLFVKAILPVRSRRDAGRRRPDQLHADKCCHLRQWLSRHGIRHASPARVSRHRSESVGAAERWAGCPAGRGRRRRRRHSPRGAGRVAAGGRGQGDHLAVRVDGIRPSPLVLRRGSSADGYWAVRSLLMFSMSR